MAPQFPQSIIGFVQRGDYGTAAPLTCGLQVTQGRQLTAESRRSGHTDQRGCVSSIDACDISSVERFCVASPRAAQPRQPHGTSARHTVSPCAIVSFVPLCCSASLSSTRIPIWRPGPHRGPCRFQPTRPVSEPCSVRTRSTRVHCAPDRSRTRRRPKRRSGGKMAKPACPPSTE